MCGSLLSVRMGGNNDDGIFYRFEIDSEATNGYCKEVTTLLVPYNGVNSDWGRPLAHLLAYFDLCPPSKYPDPLGAADFRGNPGL